MLIKPKGSFQKIVKVKPEQFESFNMVEIFGFTDMNSKMGLIERALSQAAVHPGFGSLLKMNDTPPDNEPVGSLLCYPNTYRSGLLLFLIEIEGVKTIDGASIYFSDGVQHRFRIEKISVSRNRSQGILHGSLNNTIKISLYEPAFIADRQWHGEDSQHEVLIYGIPYYIEIGTPPPLEIIDHTKQDGSKVFLNFNNAAIIMPMDDAPASYYSIYGPIKKITPYELDVLVQKTWRIRVTIARIGEASDDDVDIDLFVPFSMFEKNIAPKEGDMIHANARMCTRLMLANSVMSMN